MRIPSQERIIPDEKVRHMDKKRKYTKKFVVMEP
jgi:hypothetical protein